MKDTQELIQSMEDLLEQAEKNLEEVKKNQLGERLKKVQEIVKRLDDVKKELQEQKKAFMEVLVSLAVLLDWDGTARFKIRDSDHLVVDTRTTPIVADLSLYCNRTHWRTFCGAAVEDIYGFISKGGKVVHGDSQQLLKYIQQISELAK